MKYFVERMPNDDDYAALLKGAPQVDLEWTRILSLAYKHGVKMGTGRHLLCSDFILDYVRLSHRLSKAVIRRKLSENLVKLIQALPKEQHYICPRLHDMTTIQFGNEWRDVCRASRVKVHMLTLTWRYRHENKHALRLERAMSYLERIARDWLDEDQVNQLWVDAKDWILLPPKRDTRGQRRTREELLARSGGL
jgi:hypothetical protein